MEPRQYLIDLRAKLGLTQGAMAERMGVPYRTYQAIETGQNPARPVHIAAAQMAALTIAFDDKDITVLPEHLQAMVRAIAASEGT